MKVYESDDFSVVRKDDNSPLTRADRRAHEVIEAALAQTGVPLLSEEGADIPAAERQQWQLYWLIDPLDGTKEFIKRNGEFTVNIALMASVKQPAAGCRVTEKDGATALRYNKGDLLNPWFLVQGPRLSLSGR